MEHLWTENCTYLSIVDIVPFWPYGLWCRLSPPSSLTFLHITTTLAIARSHRYHHTHRQIPHPSFLVTVIWNNSNFSWRASLLCPLVDPVICVSSLLQSRLESATHHIVVGDTAGRKLVNALSSLSLLLLWRNLCCVVLLDVLCKLWLWLCCGLPSKYNLVHIAVMLGCCSSWGTWCATAIWDRISALSYWHSHLSQWVILLPFLLSSPVISASSALHCKLSPQPPAQPLKGSRPGQLIDPNLDRFHPRTQTLLCNIWLQMHWRQKSFVQLMLLPKKSGHNMR